MKRALWLLCCSVGLGCSADPADGGSGGAAATGGHGGVTTANGSGAGGAPSSGAGGMLGVAGTQATAGASGSAATGGAGGSSAGAAGSAGSGGVAGGASGGNAGSCTPDPSGTFSIASDTVHDSKTCLDWMKTTQTQVNYAAAETLCADSMIGGFDDWRIPSASEFASIVTLCGKYPPEGPVDPKFFDKQGDGYWTTTPAAEPNKICAIGTDNGGGYYHYGTAGPQVVRCVRGTGTVKMVTDCITAMGCKDW
jgi:hypothetical protein